MFENIGNKIKKLADAICWIGMIASLIIGLSFVDSLEAGFGTIVIGSLVSWIGSFSLYGFGELVDANSVMKAKICRIEKSISNIEKSMCKENNSAE